MLGGATLAMFRAIAGHAAEPPETIRAQAARDANMPIAADAAGCGANPIGSLVVATVDLTPIITLFANGHPVTLLLDTGAERTTLTPDVAERIGAQPPRVEFQRQVHSITGALAVREVELQTFSAGDVAIPWHRVVVAPFSMSKVLGAPLDGLLGADILSAFDIDLDLPNHRMVFYDRQSCQDAAPDWPQPYSVINTGLSRAEHLFFVVQLDNLRLFAFIDTGAQFSVLSARAARALNVTAAALAYDKRISLRGPMAGQVSAHLHQFTRLQVGAMVVRNPELVVAELALPDADIVLGIDFLSSRRLWLSYGSLRIFLSGQ